MYRKGSLLEYTKYNGSFYAISLNSIKQLIDTYSYGSIIVDTNGAKKLRETFPNSMIIIGVIAPYEECKQNLVKRKDKDIDKRLATYSDEINSVIELIDIIINNSKSNWKKTFNLIQIIKVVIENYVK